MQLNHRSYRSFILVILMLAGLFVQSFVTAEATKAADTPFTDILIQKKWIVQDHLVGTPGITRPYTWGPSVTEAPTLRLEPYDSSPGGQREVQYFDKARMEINNSDTGTVTSGLAVKELVSGLRQDGDTKFIQLTPSKTQVAGDAVSVNPNAPVYASFNQVVTLGGPDSRSRASTPGVVITLYIAKDGTTTSIAPPEGLTIGAYEANTGHNIAKPFVDFMNQTGPVTDPISGATIQNTRVYTSDPTSNIFGLAISEPSWVSTKIAGVDRLVLVQLFERRVLTYNPALPGSAVQKVEMGNLGQHYYQWRYVENSPSSVPPTTPPPASNNTNYPAIYCLPAITSPETRVYACADPANPTQNSQVTVWSTLILDGKAVYNASLRTTWHYKTVDVTCNVVADPKYNLVGCYRYTSEATLGYTVKIDVAMDYNGQTYYSQTSFTPVGSVAPPPTTAPGTTVQITYVLGGKPGDTAVVEVQTAANASCSIVYFTPNGTRSTAQGLENRSASESGFVLWDWKIGTETKPGTGRVDVTCNGITASAPIDISS